MNAKRIHNEINKLVEQSFKAGKADEAFISKVTATIKKQSTTDAIKLLNLYLKGLKRKIAENTLTVESAVKLSETDLKNIKKSLNRDVYAIEQKLNPSLLGGLRLKIGSEFLDFSLKSKISQVASKIKG